MHVFVTGAAGFIGRSVTAQLIARGHTVTGLARNDENAAILTKLGAKVHRGDLRDLDSLTTGASQADAVIHLAFIRDFNDFAGVCAVDRAAITALREGLIKSPGDNTHKAFVLANGTLLCANGQEVADVVTEEIGARSTSPFSVRSQSADLVLAMAKETGIRASVIRLPPTVHADGTGGFAGGLIRTYQAQIDALGSSSDSGKKVVAIYPKGTKARWPACYRDDAANLFVLAAEKGQGGKSYHAVTEEGVPVREIIQLVGRVLHIRSKPYIVESDERPATATGTFADLTSQEGEPLYLTSAQVTAIAGPVFPRVMRVDNAASSAMTRRELGWTTSGPGLVQDFEACLLSK